MSKEKKESIQKYLREKSGELDSPGMSAVFSALKDIDGVEQVKSKKKMKAKEKDPKVKVMPSPDKLTDA